MSFGQGGPPWGAGEGQQNQDPNQNRPAPWQGGTPYGSGPQGHDPYGNRAQGPDGGPFGQGGGPGTPDWAALADASASRARRRRRLMIGGGALATVAIAALVATAIVTSNNGSKGADRADGKESATSGPTEPGPSFSSVAPPPPPNPNDFIADEKKDKAPLTLDGLFPGTTITAEGRTYTEAANHRTANCASVAQRGLVGALRSNNCDQVFRATYQQDGLAVTVGIAVFGTTAEARRAKETMKNIAPLAGKGVGSFCQGGRRICLFTSNQVGRYAYYTATGYTGTKNVTTGDTRAYRMNNDVADFVFRQIAARGTAQASAAVGGPGN
ncbi:hypothetical protein [Streptomyces sp. NPDC058953]|uniref:hypothetical protein n=1 Tax=unclassified Streptomyces TaxID=2593676 RepID=UPI00369E5F12